MHEDLYIIIALLTIALVGTWLYQVWRARRTRTNEIVSVYDRNAITLPATERDQPKELDEDSAWVSEQRDSSR